MITLLLRVQATNLNPLSFLAAKYVAMSAKNNAGPFFFKLATGIEIFEKDGISSLTFGLDQLREVFKDRKVILPDGYGYTLEPRRFYKIGYRIKQLFIPNHLSVLSVGIYSLNFVHLITVDQEWMLLSSGGHLPTIEIRPNKNPEVK